MQTIRDDLNKFGVHHDSWYYESSTIKDREDIKMIEVLQKNNYVYEKKRSRVVQQQKVWR